MEELEKTAKALIWDIAERAIKSLKDNGLLAEPSKLQMLCSRPEMTSLIKKLSAPKYDPSRLFKKGDMVRVVECKGRNYSNVETGKEGIVSRNETGADMGIEVTFGDDDFWDICPSFLELVTPVEELEPYFVMELKGGYGVYNTRFQPETEACLYWNEMHPHAKEAAEAERDRLNAEYRKEQCNEPKFV